MECLVFRMMQNSFSYFENNFYTNYIFVLIIKTFWVIFHLIFGLTNIIIKKHAQRCDLTFLKIRKAGRGGIKEISSQIFSVDFVSLGLANSASQNLLTTTLARIVNFRCNL